MAKSPDDGLPLRFANIYCHTDEVMPSNVLQHDITSVYCVRFISNGKIQQCRGCRSNPGWLMNNSSELSIFYDPNNFVVVSEYIIIKISKNE